MSTTTSWVSGKLMERMYDKHGPDFREWVMKARSGETPAVYGVGMPPGFCQYGLHTNASGEPGLWIHDGISGFFNNQLFIPARFLVDVDFFPLKPPPP